MASAPSPSSSSTSSSPAKTSAAISPTSSSSSSSSSSQASAPPPLTSQPPFSQPNATPDLPLAPPPSLSSSPPLSSPSLSSSPPPPSPPPLSPPPLPPPPPALSPPPPQLATPSPPLPISPPPSTPTVSTSPPPLSSPPPSSQPITKSPPLPVPAAPADSSPPPLPPSSSPPPPKTKTPLSPSLSSPPPSPPSLSTSPPFPSPTTNSSSATKSAPTPTTETASPPVSQFPLATPTTPTPSDSNPPNGTIVSPNAPGINRNSNSGTNQGVNSSPTRGAGEGLSAGAAASIAIVIVFLVASFIVAGVWYVKKKRRPADGYNSVFVVPSPVMTSPKSGDTLSPLGRAPITPFTYNSNYTSGSLGPKGALTDISLGNSKYFTYEELHDITNGFSANNVLGEGGFGCVYKGQLQDGRDVAVKRLTGGGGQGEREFQAEVEIISRVHHRHLVSLVGYCIENEQRLLVYDYVPNNTLHYHLHVHGRPVLEWAIRVKIAAGAARGIAYLHEDCHPRIIHRDIKSSNILLDNDFEALVADFGLARLALDAVTHVTTRVMGTFGYLAPEYASSGKLTERSDVFSFGVVLLELITGRKPVDTSRPLGDESLVEWARPLLTQALETGTLEQLIDPRLEENYNKVEMLRMIEAAAACVRHSASRRPRMSQVVRVLDSLSDVDLTNGVQPGKSELFNVANSAEIRLFQKMAFGSHDYDYSSEFSQTSTSSTVNLNPNTRRDYHNLL